MANAAQIPPLGRLRRSNMAELVAGVLRQRIVDGQLADGDLLPKQENLAREFGTSSASVREGLRILEGEGLVTVRRGRLGGAVVHAPAGGSAAYMMGLVLESRGVQLKEIGAVLHDLEPVCAGLCAERRDRRRTVVPQLRAIHEAQVVVADDLVEGTRLGRRFHEVLVQSCGRETMVVLLGVLESIWSAHSQQSVAGGQLARSAPRKSYLAKRSRDHEELIGLIDDGKADAAVALAREHLARSTYYVTGGVESTRVIDAALLGRYIDSTRQL
jgi:GntR family transcriptional regulator, transcriptional repressor for pyruvate dehydrogenase complex